MIRRIVITGNRSMMDKHEDREPSTLPGAQYSLPFSAAVTLIATLPTRWLHRGSPADAEIRELSKRVETVVDQQAVPPLPREAAEIVIETDSGRRVLNVSDYKGSPNNPFRFDDFSGKSALLRRSASVRRERRRSSGSQAGWNRLMTCKTDDIDRRIAAGNPRRNGELLQSSPLF